MASTRALAPLDQVQGCGCSRVARCGCDAVDGRALADVTAVDLAAESRYDDLRVGHAIEADPLGGWRPFARTPVRSAGGADTQQDALAASGSLMTVGSGSRSGSDAKRRARGATTLPNDGPTQDEEGISGGGLEESRAFVGRVPAPLSGWSPAAAAGAVVNTPLLGPPQGYGAIAAALGGAGPGSGLTLGPPPALGAVGVGPGGILLGGGPALGPGVASAPLAGVGNFDLSDFYASMCCNIGTFCITGSALGGLNAVDSIVQGFMQTNGIPNLSMAIVAPDGRLVVARGYTNCSAFPTTSEIFVAQPTSRYRIMSVTKTITATAIMQLAEAGKLTLTDTLADHIGSDFGGYSNAGLEDAQLLDILCHLSDLGFGDAWNVSTYGNQIQQDDSNVAARLGKSLPVSEVDILEYAARFVDFAPHGACTPAYSYSNFGYLALGRVVRAASGRSYESYVQENIFAPIGMRDMALAGARKSSDRAYDEVQYYRTSGSASLAYTAANLASCSSPYGTSVIDSSGACMEVPYGGLYNIENFDGFGGWIGHAIDLCAWAWEMHDTSVVSVISPGSLATMAMNWASADCNGSSGNYGLGWTLNIQITGDRGHRGSKEGSRSLVYMFPASRATPAGGAVLAILMNRNPDEVSATAWTSFLNQLIGTNTANGVLDSTTDWGMDDLSSLYSGDDESDSGGIMTPLVDPRDRIVLSEDAIPRGVDDSWLRYFVFDYSRYYRWPFTRYWRA
jgi:CubicO group peptidase (beta-lactamase class C family)